MKVAQTTSAQSSSPWSQEYSQKEASLAFEAAKRYGPAVHPHKDLRILIRKHLGPTSDLGGGITSEVKKRSAVEDRLPEDHVTTKAYIDRSMDAVRAQNDARFAEMLSEIKSVHVDMNARLSAISADIHSLTLTTQNSLEASREAKQAANAAESVSRGAADLARTHNWNILMAMIAVVAVILALGGLWMTAMQTVRSLAG